MSIQSVNKAVLGRKEKKKKKAVNAYLIKNSKRERGGGGGRKKEEKRGWGVGVGGWVGALSQAVGRIGRSSMGV